MTTELKAKDGGTMPRPIRVPVALWEDFRQVADKLGTNRTALLVDFMRYMAEHPGSRMPRRPKTPPASTSA